ncbi:terminase large subunit domain-containing protein [Methylomagnum ishizawai]|uniref:terminase large subunit domain-containing protein n=1 Tax=Methylomagnum ishizawai TaxID=1760988 RepID=UPI001C7FF84C|nr:terminase family protein [Methylomagnum ishizawai]
MAKPYSPEIRASAKRLFLRGFTMEEIRAELRLPNARRIYDWREQEGWDALAPTSGVEEVVSRRICVLADREDKSKAEQAELEMLLKRLEALAVPLAKARRIDRAPLDAPLPDEGETDETEAQPKRRKNGQGKREKKVKNDVSGITAEQLAAVREKLFFSYQLEWHARRYDPETRRTRFILKSRQIGATYYFAWEAFENAVLTGDNQIFLSSSRDQAEVFKAYIIAFAQTHFGVELKGSPAITLSNGAELRFVSTNASTAASYHGHLYVDEIFWIPNFRKVWDQASGMASHKKWTRTLFSVPSAISHPAYELWSGEHFNKAKAKKDQAEFDISHAGLKAGKKGADRFWRQIVTIEDAAAAGCDLFDLEQLQDENGGKAGDAFRNKYLCHFIDDSKSAFNLTLLLACGVDPGEWKDFKPQAARPFGNRPVAIGYDPSRTGDNASVVVLAVPLKPADPWRVLERIDMRKVSYESQARRIKEFLKCYNVVHIGVDVSGEGRGVWPYLQDLPQAMPMTYNLNFKADLVTKALDVVQPPPRLQFDAKDKDITAAFLMIHTTTTPGTNQITYHSARTNALGHADVAWAIMHALIYEPINAAGNSTRVAFS